MSTLIPPPLGLGRPSQKSKKYKLSTLNKFCNFCMFNNQNTIQPPFDFPKIVMVQNPVRARCCGFGEKDRRPVDPPPILQLFIERPDGTLQNAQ